MQTARRTLHTKNCINFALSQHQQLFLCVYGITKTIQGGFCINRSGSVSKWKWTQYLLTTWTIILFFYVKSSALQRWRKSKMFFHIINWPNSIFFRYPQNPPSNDTMAQTPFSNLTPSQSTLLVFIGGAEVSHHIGLLLTEMWWHIWFNLNHYKVFYIAQLSITTKLLPGLLTYSTSNHGPQ